MPALSRPRWSFASAGLLRCVAVIKLVPGPLTPKDSHWHHTASAWWFDMAMLVAL
ncbi:hypothetical protein GR254_13995, partial [Mycobacterium tuberculosis]|nr:hypothetical protein [Mycobacterium tuberculosis]